MTAKKRGFSNNSWPHQLINEALTLAGGFFGNIFAKRFVLLQRAKFFPNEKKLHFYNLHVLRF